MSHVRTQIRDAAYAALVAQFGETATVYASRYLPLEEADLPAIIVYTSDEEVGAATMEAYGRSLELVVESKAKGADIDATLDALLVQVEVALNANRLGGLCKPLALGSITAIIDTSASTPLGRHRIVYRAVYFTAHGNPEAAA
jgi:hypothetical protein